MGKIKKFALISIQKQDPDSKISLSGKLENKATYKIFLNHQPGGALLIFIVSALMFYPPSSVHAGILSFVGDIFNDLSFSKDFLGVSVNSQTMALLEAVRNSDPSPDPDNSDVIIVNHSAILANSVSDQPMENTPTSDQISVYVVRKGDTLSAIAKMFGVSTNTILWANDIPKGGGVKVGQKLVILPVSGIQYTIKKGDTVAKIAAVYKADVDEIRDANNLENGDGLTVGGTVIIPNGVESEAPITSPIKTIKKALGSLVNTVSSPTVSTDGYFVRPTVGRKTQGIHGHNGVDFHADKGTAVVAAAAGTVVVSLDSGWNGGYGQYVVIKHSNGTQTLYAHLSNNMVSEGQTVSQGQTVGLSGDTGKSFGPHLHFEVRGGRNPF